MKTFCVYWESNDGNEMTREIGWVAAYNQQAAIMECGVQANYARFEIAGEDYPDARYIAEEVTSVDQIQEMVRNMLWESKWVTSEETRNQILEGLRDVK